MRSDSGYAPHAGPAKPGVMPLFYRVLKLLAKQVVNLQTRLVLSAFYLVVIGAYALWIRLVPDPFRPAAGPLSRWVERRRPLPKMLPEARRQF